MFNHSIQNTSLGQYICDVRDTSELVHRLDRICHTRMEMTWDNFVNRYGCNQLTIVCINTYILFTRTGGFIYKIYNKRIVHLYRSVDIYKFIDMAYKLASEWQKVNMHKE